MTIAARILESFGFANGAAALELGPAAPRPTRPAPPNAEPLDTSNGYEGLGRSLSFPFNEWRATDRFQTVFFDEGEGHPLVFVHGLGANATHFEFIVERFVHTHRVVGLDLVGCGWTRKPDGPYSIERLRDHLVSFLDDRGIRNATLIGHSLGGAVCLSTALERPDQCSGLVLLSAAGVAPLPRWTHVAGPMLLHRRTLFAALVVGADFIVDNVFVTRAEDNPHVQWFRDTSMRDEVGYPNLREFARVSSTLCRDVMKGDFSHRLGELNVPVLGLWGDDDKLVGLTNVLDRLGAVSRLRSVVLKDCGHMPMIEYPLETARHIERFLENPPL